MSQRADRKTSKLTVLISGSGSNLQAIIDACNTPALPDTQVIRVISDQKKAYGLTRAEHAGIPRIVHEVGPYKKQYPSTERDPQKQQWRRAFDTDLAELVLKDSPDLIVCAGYMKILTPSFLQPVADAKIPIINLHPSLHGDLVGAGCIERAWEEFQQGKRTKTGAMIHYVIVEVDLGEPIVQREVDMQGCQTLNEVQARIHDVEHVLIVEGVKAVLDKRR